MEGGEICKTLPDHLVETIVSLVPFPAIFKFRCLSKAWLVRLSPIPDEEDDAKKQLATSFQKLVAEKSANWKTFSPVFINMEGALIPYDLQATQNWRNMPSLSFLPKNMLLTKSDLQIEGVLALILAMHESHGEIYVANILNRTWRSLPPSPCTMRYAILCSKLVLIDTSLGTYKVILFCEVHFWNDTYYVEIYDSKSDSWTSNKFCEREPFYGHPGANFAYLNGFVYIVSECDPECDPPKLCASGINLEDGSVTELELLFNENFSPVYYYFLVACKEDLLMVIERTDFVPCIEVRRIDLESLTLVHLADTSVATLPDTDTIRRIRLFSASDGNCIFFSVYSDHRLLKYEIENDTWSWLPFPKIRGVGQPLTSFSFVPGLSPFAAV